MTYINTLSYAIDYWRSKKGGNTYAGDDLIRQIKRAIFKIIEEDLIPGIRLKIKNARKNRKYHIKSAKGSRRGS